MNEPELRFKADDGTEFPVLEKQQILDILSQPITDGPHETPPLVDSGVPFISVDAIVDNKIDFDKKRGFIPEEYNEQCNKKYKPQKNDVYLVKSGATVGKVAYVEDNKEFNIWSPIAAMRVNANNSYLFLYYFLQTEHIQNEIKIKSFGGTQPNLSMRILEKIHIDRPCLEEQQKIADLFSTLDNVIDSVRKEVDSWEQMKRGVMQKLFSQEVRFKADDGSEFPEWEEMKLSDICNIVGGGTPSTKQPEFWDGDIPWISSADLETNNILDIHKSRYITQEAINNSATKKIPKDSVLIISRVGVGKVALADEVLCTSQDFTNMVNLSENPLFIAYYMSRRMQTEAINVQGTSIKGIPSKDIQEYLVKLPCKQEQQKIADCLSEFDTVINIIKQKLKGYQQLKKGLMQQMFL